MSWRWSGPSNALIVYLDDTPVGAGEYEFKIHFHPAPPKPAPARASTAGNLKSQPR